MKSKWKVAYSDGYYEDFDGHVKTVWKEGYGDDIHEGWQKCYMVYRLLDANKADEADNREIQESTWSKERARELVNKLNALTKGKGDDVKINGNKQAEVKEALQDFIIRACKETASDKEVEVLPEAVLAYIELLLKS